MELIETPIPDAFIIEPSVFGDDRGFFLESWNSAAFAAAGLDLTFVQDNHSRSSRGVLRGLHYQNPGAQGKLVRVTAGAIYDVIVDLRRSSASMGKWFGVELNERNKRMLWAPPGVAHGFLCLEDDTDLLYKCTSFYDPQNEHSLRWDDPAIGIEWPLGNLEPLLSTKDRYAPSLSKAVMFP